MTDQNYDAVIIGAGGAGMMCAAVAAARGLRVVVLDHSQKLAEKIRISGGGRCNFTNVNAAPNRYLSDNPHFCKSALRQYTQHDFIALVEKYGIAYHEKTLGQLFCDNSAQEIIDMLRNECEINGAGMYMGCDVSEVLYDDGKYTIETSHGIFNAAKLVIATGGLSIPKIGATPFGFKIAEQFGLNVLPVRAGLVPLTFQDDMLELCRTLSGLSIDAIVSCGKTSFREGLLFTHRGLSGPSILQISSYWQDGDCITVNLTPDDDAYEYLLQNKKTQAKKEIQTVLSGLLPSRLATGLCEFVGIAGRIADMPDKKLRLLADHVNGWKIKPGGTEGYRTAEVTLGGVDTADLSSKTMESKNKDGLYFIGEVVDVTGHLGGYNFQWAWSSGYACGSHL